jgi:rare lipoprotein A
LSRIVWPFEQGSAITAAIAFQFKAGTRVMLGKTCLSVAALAAAGWPGVHDVLAAEHGMAAVYSYRGGKTASGEASHPEGLTAAHRSLPFGSKVRVTNHRNGRSVVVRINDRGPFTRGRIIDLTPGGARQLGFSSLAPVSLERIGR